MILKANKKNLLSVLVLFILSSIVISGIAIAEDTEEEEPIVSEPGPEWWFNGFVLGELQTDADVVIDFVSASIETRIEKDTSQRKSFISTTTYKFSGTCGNDVNVINIYKLYDWMGEDMFKPFYSPKDLQGIVEIEPSGGAWEIVYKTVGTINQDEYDSKTKAFDGKEDTKLINYTFLAMASTENTRYNYDTISFEYKTIIETQEDLSMNAPSTEERSTAVYPINIYEDPPEMTLVPVFSIGAVLAIAAIMLLLVYLYWR